MVERTKEQVETIKLNSKTVLEIVNQRTIRDDTKDNQWAIAYEVIDTIEALVDYDLQKPVSKLVLQSIDNSNAKKSIKKHFDLMY